MQKQSKKKLWLRAGLLAASIGAVGAMAPAVYAAPLAMYLNFGGGVVGKPTSGGGNAITYTDSAKMLYQATTLTVNGTQSINSYNGTYLNHTNLAPSLFNTGGPYNITLNSTTLSRNTAPSSTPFITFTGSGGDTFDFNASKATWFGGKSGTSSSLTIYVLGQLTDQNNTYATSPGNASFTISLNQTGGATGTVTGSYTLASPAAPTVPAPGSLAVFGAGLLALAGIRRYKKQS